MSDNKKKTILFIDDDEDDFLLLKDAFKDVLADVDLRWARGGEEAIAYLGKKDRFHDVPQPALMLLDLNMPKMNGFEVIGVIRQNAEWHHIPVVMLSNSMSRKEAMEAYRLGINSFVRKPAGYKELTDFVQTLYRYWFEYSTLVPE